MLAAGFNGGPSNCSAKPVRRAGVGPRHHGASMEGRAIARPNRLPRLCGRAPRRRFNGGPSNCSAKRGGPPVSPVVEPPLQWRPEQLLGQPASRSILRYIAEKLQWRAEQLLGQTSPGLRTWPAISELCFNGGPSNCSAKHVPSAVSFAFSFSLQWRAEQLLGQTWLAGSKRGPAARFNGGPSNCSAKRGHRRRSADVDRRASMEGRAIAQPNDPVAWGGAQRPEASMEGRAIARPNVRIL